MGSKKGHLQWDSIQEYASLLKGLEGPFDQDRNYRDSSSNRQEKKRRLKLLHTTALSPCPFRENDNGDALREEVGCLLQALQPFLRIFAI